MLSRTRSPQSDPVSPLFDAAQLHDEAGLSQGGLKAQFLPKGCTGSKYAGRLGPFIDKNSAAIVAVFTIVLAFSTILLWLGTQEVGRGSG